MHEEFSPGWRSEIDLNTTLGIEKHDGFYAVRSRLHPDHVWGNFLLFEALPRKSKALTWIGLHEMVFPGRAAAFSTAFGWMKDRQGTEHEQELIQRGFAIGRETVFCAGPRDIAPVPGEGGVLIEPVSKDIEWRRILDNRIRAFATGKYQDFKQRFEQDKFQQFKALSRQGRGNWFVLRLAGAEVGDMGIFLDTGGGARLQEVWIYPQHQGKGLGKMMVALSCRAMLSRFDPDVFISVTGPDSPAGGLYRSIGFKQAGTLARAVLIRQDLRLDEIMALNGT
ncbi:GNAT family N-acetyltransferase [Roseibium marinum]|uniref:Ribosomal protein S18 acetylase RimI-like enzyme n=1 Tax=Roseibium marinum TaxID=281252 RepID=A0A2S3USI3_9HYPH|nr:GNAT family N-acetyltransferase [Roseibium marinum]POF30523.1 ribosomal protein S18 acetylase RimI-like enzyme [Roseibium marinum]